jgi:hypothetical protein
MAITDLGTINSLKTSQLPAGYTAPSIATFTDWEYRRELNLTVLKATVDEATTAATMTAIFDNATIGLDKQVEDIIAATYISTQTVTTWAELVKLETNNSDVLSGEGTWLKDTAESYTAKVILYIKSL